MTETIQNLRLFCTARSRLRPRPCPPPPSPVVNLPSLETNAAPLLKPEPIDHRFDDPAWPSFPFLWWQQAFLVQDEWWRGATRPLRGMKTRDAERIGFMVHESLDVFSPSNAAWLNPVVIERTRNEAGQSRAWHAQLR